MALRDITKNKAYIARQSATAIPVVNPIAPVTTQPKIQQNFGMGSAEGGPVTPRQAPTVATTNQPVISKTLNNSLVYDPTNPEDYLMKLQARTTTGKVPTEQEYYNALQAQKALQASNTNQVNPLQTTLDELTKQQQLLRGQETTSDKNQLELYKQQLDQQYGQQRDELLASGERQRGAAQNVYSFSGFGRSTAAADKMVEIQKGTDSAINVLNAAKQAAIAAKEAELNGADSETLAALNARVQQYQDQANKRQIDSLKATADANKSSGASYIESLNNLMTTASKSGMDIGNPEDIQIYAQMARNPDGSINEEFVAALPEGMQAIIRSANISTTKEAPKIENFGTTKSPRYMQRDGTKRVPVSGAGGGSMQGSGGGGGGGVTGGGTAGVGGVNTAGVQKKDIALVNLLGQYKNVLDETSYLGLKADPNKQAQAQNLLSQITAEYKNAKKLGTLDTGVQRLIDGLVGKGGGFLSLSTYSNDAQSNAVKGFIESLGGQVATPTVPSTPTTAPKTTPVVSKTKRASIFN